MAKRIQTYICPKCGKTKTITAALSQSTASFVEQLRNTIQCDGCRSWMARIEEVQEVG